jgi:hypothetical protein
LSISSCVIAGKETQPESWPQSLAKNGVLQRYFSGDSEFSTAWVGAEPGEYQASQRIAPTRGRGFVADAAKLLTLRKYEEVGTRLAAREAKIALRVKM